MKGDFSKLSFDPRKHYGGVLHQQGRVELDSDRNDDVIERLNQLAMETSDIVGVCGVPEPGTGFRITPNPDLNAQPDDFLIGGGLGARGHAYVDGILCQNDQNTSYLRQPDLPSPTRISMPTDGSAVNAVVYLEVWQRLITYLEDETIREVALNGPDTATRLKTIAQVKVALLPSTFQNFNCPNIAGFLPRDGSGLLTTLPPVDTQPPDPCRIPDPSTFTGRENHLYRVEIHSGGDVLGGQGSAASVRLGQDASAGTVTLVLSRSLTAAEADAMNRSGVITISDDDGRTESRTLAGISTDRQRLTLSRGLSLAFTTARNATVTGGAAQFKWSRDNASFAVSVKQVKSDRRTLTLASLGRDLATALRGGDLVEITDDASELGPARGHLTFLIADPDPDELTAVIADPLPPNFGVTNIVTSPPGSPPSSPPIAPAPGGHLLLRKWDGQGPARTVFDEKSTPEMNFGDGVRIQFGGFDLRPGDFWVFAARNTDGSIEHLTAAPPAGIIRHRCPLAIVRWSPVVSSPPGSPPGSPPASPPGSPPFSNFQMAVLHDCRTVFAPLAEPAIHITNVQAVDLRNRLTDLVNDSVVPLQRLLAGINIEMDNSVAPADLARPVCFVTVDLPWTITGAGVAPAAAASAYLRLILAGDANAVNDPATPHNFIAWRMRDRTALARLPFNTVPAEDRGILARLVLNGNFIWANGAPDVFLDGESFGFRRGGTQGTLVHLPSGDRKRGGPFEMWFWIQSRQPVPGGPFVLVANTGVPPTARAEGLTELVADIILTGTGGTPTALGATVPTFNLTVTLNTTIGNPAAASDIILTIDEPTVFNTRQFSSATPIPVINQDGDPIDFQGGDAPNIFRGVISGNSVTFNGVPIEAPGGGSNVVPRILRITNIRANATTISTGGLASNQIVALISLSGGGAALAIQNSTQVVAFVTSGNTFNLLTAAGLPVPTSPPAPPFTLSAAAGENVQLAAANNFTGARIDFQLQFSESIPDAFRPRKLGVTGLGVIHDDETGFDNQGAGSIPIRTGDPALPAIGAATNGLRFRATFNNIPQGVQLFVTTRNIPVSPEPPVTAPDVPPARATLVTNPATDGSGGTVPTTVPTGSGALAANIPIVPLTINANRSAVAVWETVRSVPVQNEQMRFGVVLAAPPGVVTPSVAAPTVSGTIAPVATVGATSAAVPRFADTSVTLVAFAISR